MTNREFGLLKIGEFAEKGGVSKRSLRHYENLGILTPTRRTEGGFRLYDENHLFKLQVIKIFKELGFSLEEISEIFSNPQTSSDDSGGNQLVHSIEVLEKQLEKVNERLEDLKSKRSLIENGMKALRECRNCSRESCPDRCDNLRYFL